jgi:hypothetical protein
MPRAAAPKNERAWFFVSFSTSLSPWRWASSLDAVFPMGRMGYDLRRSRGEIAWLFSMTSSVAGIG